MEVIFLVLKICTGIFIFYFILAVIGTFVNVLTSDTSYESKNANYEAVKVKEPPVNWLRVLKMLGIAIGGVIIMVAVVELLRI